MSDLCYFCGRPLLSGDKVHVHHVMPRADGGDVDGPTVRCHAACHNEWHRDQGHYERWSRARHAERVAMFGRDEVHRLLAHWGRQGYDAACRGDPAAWHRAGGKARARTGSRNSRGRFCLAGA